MDPNLVAQAALGGAPVDFSIWTLFMRADVVVKAVMIGLVFASFWSWAIVFDKWGRIGGARKRMDRFEDLFWMGGSAEDLYKSLKRKPEGPMAAMFVAGMQEWERSRDAGAVSASSADNLRERIDKVMTVTLNRELAVLERRLGFLATVGATAPFVGLFGTVWGIMNSFRAIAVSHDTNLAVVAPGIAEALFATALGLLAAIPAVVFFNKFSNEIGRLAVRLEGFADEFITYFSRKFDERGR